MATALITGASRGVGEQVARALAPTHDLLLVARDSERLDALAGELGATAIALDLTDPGAVAGAVEEHADALADLAVVVHCAGIASTLHPVAETSADEWRRLLEINVIAAAELTRLLLASLRSHDGHLVFLNSGAGQRVNPGWTPYAASKFALRALADGIRAEEPAVRVTSLYPGRIDTEMQRQIVATEGGTYDPAQYLTAETVAAAVAQAVATPADAHPTDITLRPRKH